jgi:hypothetical protein
MKRRVLCTLNHDPVIKECIERMEERRTFTEKKVKRLEAELKQMMNDHFEQNKPDWAAIEDRLYELQLMTPGEYAAAGKGMAFNVDENVLYLKLKDDNDGLGALLSQLGLR